MEENTKMVLNGSLPTSHTYPIMPKAAYPSRTKISPTAMTSATHLNLPSVSPFAARLTEELIDFHARSPVDDLINFLTAIQILYIV